MKILIVEDEQKLANSLQKGLSNEGFTTEVAYDGRAGLRYITQNMYDLMILDLMIPYIDGINLLKAIREKGNNTPVIILTAKSQLDDIIAGLNTGSDDYLTKPFSFDELLARINAIMRRTQNTAPIINLDTAKIDTVNKTVVRGNQKLDLTKTEFAILYLFVTHLGRYFTETDILDAVWDNSYEGMSNVVRVHIKNLRNKLDKPFPNSRRLIRSERGLGYKIDP